MTYSRKKEALTRVETYLSTLADAQENVTWHTNDPVTLSYALRQACNIAKANPETYPKYKDLKERFAFKVQPGKVIATLKVPTGVLVATPLSGFIKSVDRLELPNVMTVRQIVGAVIANKQYEELFFPDASPDDTSLAQLHAWTSANAWSIVVSLSALTITKRDVGELAWKP